MDDRLARRAQPPDGRPGPEPNCWRGIPVVPEPMVPEPVAVVPRPSPVPGRAIAVPRAIPVSCPAPDRVDGRVVAVVLVPLAHVDVVDVTDPRPGADAEPGPADATNTTNATNTSNATNTADAANATNTTRAANAADATGPIIDPRSVANVGTPTGSIVNSGTIIDPRPIIDPRSVADVGTLAGSVIDPWPVADAAGNASADPGADAGANAGTDPGSAADPATDSRRVGPDAGTGPAADPRPVCRELRRPIGHTTAWPLGRQLRRPVATNTRPAADTAADPRPVGADAGGRGACSARTVNTGAGRIGPGRWPLSRE